MKFYQKLPIIFSIFVTACATPPPENSTYGWLGKTFFEPHASYVQWNEEYAVTAAHFVSPSYYPAYKSELLDIQFIKIKSNKVPVWNEFKIGEKVSMVGFPNIDQNEKKVTGYTTGKLAVFNGVEVYQLVTTKIEQGMSGGPVFNDKKEVVGINIGYTSQPVLRDGKNEIQSLFLPYGYIKQEWEKFKTNNKSSTIKIIKY